MALSMNRSQHYQANSTDPSILDQSQNPIVLASFSGDVKAEGIASFYVSNMSKSSISEDQIAIIKADLDVFFSNVASDLSAQNN